MAGDHPRFCDRVFARFLEAARIQGYETAHVRMEWMTPRKILVDPAREIPAAIQGVRATLMSQQEVMRELGYDPEQVLREWQGGSPSSSTSSSWSPTSTRAGRPARGRA